MKRILNMLAVGFILAAGALAFTSCATNDPVTQMNAANASASRIASESRAALQDLYRQNSAARQLGRGAMAILVFPKITKGGLMIGGMGGNGALVRNDGSIRDFYQTTGVSYGLQAGLQKYGYALFLMDNSALANLNRSGGWEIGGSPSLVIVDEGMSGSLTTTTLNASTYAFFFNQRGLMGGLGLQGTKITRIRPGR